MERRTFLTRSSVAGLVGLAGCAGSQPSSDTPDQSSTEAPHQSGATFETPDALLTELYSRLAGMSTSDLVHSDVQASGDAFGVREVRTNVLRADLDTDRLAGLVDLSRSEVRRVTDGADTAIARVRVQLDRGTSVDEIEESWALATEGENWQVVERVNSTASAMLTRPSTEFEFEYRSEDNAVTITPTDGDRVPASDLIVTGTQMPLDSVGRVHLLAGSEYGADERIEHGRSIEVTVESDTFEISILWQSDDESCECRLAHYTGPNFK
jgi:hypothetical protein